ncbi:tRNA (adenosine(37)-N6)-dimethylallyltransferase MiaA [Paracrocinitomix mangrovi]|uniref:tRNA (adenosine(37)-N6)-dimethylallyltransferase MiaA n=1 Tax=Paracrocinitomix mangrovi TaxID=2862509 RepID=UPI001C8D4EF7|nr:tRNA (adenosine(37)-N6)-dimethylallyltransferase MiaA [Paracrocinitomix mangrovi]UKN02425.1 tRNA (adenosine(37)-N6)-dimethylallyltransferase MiaA [Paracrocinitomix mangrovi]
MSSQKPHILVILGPTASGKTNVACNAALKLDGEIISADSRQVYKFMDIGTGKDIEEYTIDGQPIPYHLIDIKEPGYKYNIAEFQLDFIQALNDIVSRGKTPILCGGSGLYLEAALKGSSYLGIPMNEERRGELEKLGLEELQVIFEGLSEQVKRDLNNETKRRVIRAIIVDEYLKENPNFKTVDIPDFDFTIIGVDVSREVRRNKITKRLKHRVENGMIEEVEWLLQNYLTYDDLEYYGLEYKWIGQYLKKEISKEEMVRQLNIAIHQFSKRQMTWFRRMEKNGYNIHWVDGDISLKEKVDEVCNIYSAV